MLYRRRCRLHRRHRWSFVRMKRQTKCKHMNISPEWSSSVPDFRFIFFLHKSVEKNVFIINISWLTCDHHPPHEIKLNLDWIWNYIVYVCFIRFCCCCCYRRRRCCCWLCIHSFHSKSSSSSLMANVNSMHRFLSTGCNKKALKHCIPMCLFCFVFSFFLSCFRSFYYCVYNMKCLDNLVLGHFSLLLLLSMYRSHSTPCTENRFIRFHFT